MPVYWFALSIVGNIDITRAVLIFIILHVFIYPSSNGYNSYMDRDEGSIGGLAKPLQPTRQLFIFSVIMDIVAIGACFFISPVFAACIIIYIISSRLYSYRGIRLKKYPITGYLVVILVQGSLTFFMVYHGSDENLTYHMPWSPLLAAAFLIGGFYPITQVYQHKEDEADGVTTISMMLGKKGTFIFCVAMYTVAMLLLWTYYSAHELNSSFIILVIFFLPVVVYFARWFLKVLKDDSVADFTHTMKMNWLASTCTSLAFITTLLYNRLG